MKTENLICSKADICPNDSFCHHHQDHDETCSCLNESTCVNFEKGKRIKVVCVEIKEVLK